MEIKVTREFQTKLKRQITYISNDKPVAAKKLSKLIYSEIRKITNMPYKNKASKFFDSENIRELIVKGYSVIYEVLPSENKIVVFGFHKWEDELKI